MSIGVLLVEDNHSLANPYVYTAYCKWKEDGEFSFHASRVHGNGQELWNEHFESGDWLPGK